MSDESSDASGTSDGASTLVWAVVGALGALAAILLTKKSAEKPQPTPELPAPSPVATPSPVTSPAAPVPKSMGPRTYTFKTVDAAALAAFVAAAGVGAGQITELQTANPGKDLSKLKAGDTLTIPASWPDRPALYAPAKVSGMSTTMRMRTMPIRLRPMVSEDTVDEVLALAGLAPRR